MKILEHEEGRYKSYLVGEGEIFLVRAAGTKREEMLTTDALLGEGRWFATELEEIGDTFIERYSKLPDRTENREV